MYCNRQLKCIPMQIFFIEYLTTATALCARSRSAMPRQGRRWRACPTPAARRPCGSAGAARQEGAPLRPDATWGGRWEGSAPPATDVTWYYISAMDAMHQARPPGSAPRSAQLEPPAACAAGWRGGTVGAHTAAALVEGVSVVCNGVD